MTTNNEDLLLPYLMNEIKFLDVFHPRNRRDIGIWLTLYCSGLPRLTGIPYNAVSRHKFVDSPHVFCKTFNLEVIKFRVAFSSGNHFYIDYTIDDFNKNCWRYEYDAGYKHEFPYVNERLFDAKGQLTKPARQLNADKMRRELITAAADSLIFHPAAHIHIDHFITGFPAADSENPISLIDPHSIRIGSASDNIFLHLFQLRYQFCIREDRRREEKERVVDLLEGYVKRGEKINAGNLFAGRSVQ